MRSSSDEFRFWFGHIAIGFGATLLVFAGLNFLRYGFHAVVIFNLVLVVLFASSWLVVRFGRLREGVFLPLTVASFLLVHANVLFSFWTLKIHLQNSLVALLLVGVGALALPNRWFLGTLITMLGSWFPVAWQVAGSEQDLYQYGAAMLASFCLSLILHLAGQRSERRLESSESLYRELFQSSLDSIVITTPSGRLIDINPRGLEVLGIPSFEEAMRLNVRSFYIDPKQRKKVLRRLATEGSISAMGSRFKTVDGREVDFEGTSSLHKNALGVPLALLTIGRDVTERNQNEAELQKYRLHLEEVVFERTAELERRNEESLRLEQRLRQSKKLESLGLLAGGIAHDFGNLLVGLQGSIGLATTEVSSDAPNLSDLREYLMLAKTACARAMDLTSQLSRFAGREDAEFAACDLNDVVAEMIRLLKQGILSKVKLSFEMDEELPMIRADGNQLRQVVLNLIVNASEAMEGHSGTIRVETRQVEEMNENGLFHFNETLGPAPYVLLEVADTGCGMDPATVERIFDPFFTTKDSGHGLGMAMVLGTLRSHQAGIQVWSEPGQGTIMQLLFPTRLESSALVDSAAVDSTEMGPTVPGRQSRQAIGPAPLQ